MIRLPFSQAELTSAAADWWSRKKGRFFGIVAEWRQLKEQLLSFLHKRTNTPPLAFSPSTKSIFIYVNGQDLLKLKHCEINDFFLFSLFFFFFFTL